MTQEPCRPWFWNHRFSFSCDDCWQHYRAHPTWSTGLKMPVYSPFAHYPICSKQFHHVKAKSWTWISEAIFCSYQMLSFLNHLGNDSLLWNLNIIIIIIIIIIILYFFIIIIISFFFCLCMCVGTYALCFVSYGNQLRSFNNILKLKDLCLRLSWFLFFYHFSGKRLGFGSRFLT